jgi:IS1 transposase
MAVLCAISSCLAGQFGYESSTCSKTSSRSNRSTNVCRRALILDSLISSFGRGEAAEMDEMWSFAGSKSQPRGLWHAIEPHTGQLLTYDFGTREDEIFLQW